LLYLRFQAATELQRSALQKNGSDKYTPFRAKSSLPACRMGSLRGILGQAMPQTLQHNIQRKGLFKRRRVGVVVVPPVEELDLVGPMQVFSAANRLAGKPVYAVEIATNSHDLKVAGEGGLLSFLAQRRFGELKGVFDSLLLVCGVATRNARDAALFAWLRRMATEVRRVGSVCVGAFLFAEAGLLNGKRATAHWKFGEELAKRYPRVRVESNPLWVKDGNIYTSAGISAGIDLALAWVEEDCGAAIAQEVARELVLFLRRSGGQNQLSVSLSAQASEMKAIQELQVWIAENLRKNLSVQTLADRAAMSVRNFERVFTREVGRTPSHYVLQARVEAVRQQLERTDRGLKQIAAACGFGSADVMRRSFARLIGVTPNQYRSRIRTAR
jgi:transcriptional regulator GlxA family with amidase domain